MAAVNLNNKRVIISRTDSIGDVLLTLPICSWIKTNYPEAHIIFLGKSYTKPIVEQYDSVDTFVDWNEIENLSKAEQLTKFSSINGDVIIHVFPNKKIASLAKKAAIDIRVGTSHRAYHLLTCNYRPSFTRKGSDLHESQLNFKLLEAFGSIEEIPMSEIIRSTAGLKVPEGKLPLELEEFISRTEKTIILHPKSQGSAVEWPIGSYIQLAEKLLKAGYKVIFTGTESEGNQFRTRIPNHVNCIDTTGKLSLRELMTLINIADKLVACSTGPLHLAAYYNTHAIGFFSPRRPIHPGRWRPIGHNVDVLLFDENCETCKKGKPCLCIEQISVDNVISLVEN